MKLLVFVFITGFIGKRSKEAKNARMRQRRPTHPQGEFLGNSNPFAPQSIPSLEGNPGMCLPVIGEIGDIGAWISVLCSSEHMLFS